MSDLTQVETTVKADTAIATSWLKVHERLIISLVLIAVFAFGANKVMGYIADHDKQQATAAAQVAAAQAASNKALADQVAQTTVQYQQLVVQLTQQNAQLQQAAQTRTIVLHDQQTKDQTIPMPDLGNRWAQLASLPQGSLAATTEGVTITPDAARTTVSQLEEVPVLKQNLADQVTQTQNVQKELDGATDLNGKLTTQVAGLQTEIVDNKNADALELKAVKAQARKSKFKWFGAGVVVGFLGRTAEDIFTK